MALNAWEWIRIWGKHIGTKPGWKTSNPSGWVEEGDKAEIRIRTTIREAARERG